MKINWDKSGDRERFWHSTSHVMAYAVLELFPNAKPTIGPPIEGGFYYDFDVEKPFTTEDLEKIEKRMKEIVKKNYKFERKEVSRRDALKLFEKNSYKIELINELPKGENISIYKIGSFVDLCKGPHLESTGKINVFKLLKVSGAYWRGSEKNKMLQRIYGISFPKKEMLKEYLELKERALQRNHLKLGKELDLFSMHSEAPGVAFFHPKGTDIWNQLLEFWRKEHIKRGYAEVSTPVILKKELWLKSGHWQHYRENMYFTKIDEEDYAIKPMNCPGGILIYQTKRHSYRDFPMRVGEIGIVHRHELSGVLQGLFRVRKFTQDDAHIYCLPEQIKDEIIGAIDLVLYMYSIFGFKDYHIELSTKPENAMGSDEIWEKATNALIESLKEKKIDYIVNEGEGTFYGPKIDFHIKDSLGRTWQCGTIQLDFVMPEKFNLTYIGADDKEHRPIMIHRTVYGSLERFIGILIEHYGGHFPLWLSPVQTRVIAVSDKFNNYAERVHKKLINEGIRSELDKRAETVSYKVRDAEMQKIPYILNVGAKEEKQKTVAVRDRKGKVKFGVKLDEFINGIKKEIERRE